MSAPRSRRAPRVVVTRAPHQASELADALRALGAEPVLLPAIEIATPENFAALDNTLEDLASFNWLIFTSANAVEAVTQRASQLTLPQTLRVAAIGPATQRAVAGAFTLAIARIVVPPQAIAESLAETLLPFARTAEGKATKFLLVCAEKARDYLPEALRHAGADVTIAAAYSNIMPAGSVAAAQQIFAGHANTPQAITFTSSSTADNFFRLLDAAGITLPVSVQVASIGPITSATLRDLGHTPHIESSTASVEQLAKELMQHLNAHNSSEDHS